MVQPESGDVIVRPDRGNPEAYLLGTLSTPDVLIIRGRDAALAKACAFAESRQVRVWMAEGDDALLVATFRSGDLEASSSA